MTSFNPGDRVTDGKKILWVQYCHETDYRLCVSDSPDGVMHYPVQPSNLRPAWQECKDCDGDNFAPNACDDCPTCKGTGRINRTGPYRLASGAWSDGVDRRGKINFRKVSDRTEVLVLFSRSGAFSTFFVVWHQKQDHEFPTFTEAINYAHKVAREVAK